MNTLLIILTLLLSPDNQLHVSDFWIYDLDVDSVLQKAVREPPVEFLIDSKTSISTKTLKELSVGKAFEAFNQKLAEKGSKWRLYVYGHKRHKKAGDYMRDSDFSDLLVLLKRDAETFSIQELIKLFRSELGYSIYYLDGKVYLTPSIGGP